MMAMLLQLHSDNNMGFWEALTLHIVGLPIDGLIVFLLTSWAYLILQTAITDECKAGDLS